MYLHWIHHTVWRAVYLPDLWHQTNMNVCVNLLLAQQVFFPCQSKFVLQENHKRKMIHLKIIHSRFPKCYLFMDKASPHYKSKKVLKYLDENRNTITPIYLPTASPEFMILEETWNIAKRDLLLVLKYYSSFADFKEKISRYFRTKRFNLNMRNYLLRAV